MAVTNERPSTARRSTTASAACNATRSAARAQVWAGHQSRRGPRDYIVEACSIPSKVKEGYIAFTFTMKDGSQMTASRRERQRQFIRVGPGEIPLVKTNIAKRDTPSAA
jgi:hypothetical protein